MAGIEENIGRQPVDGIGRQPINPIGSGIDRVPQSQGPSVIGGTGGADGPLRPTPVILPQGDRQRVQKQGSDTEVVLSRLSANEPQNFRTQNGPEEGHTSSMQGSVEEPADGSVQEGQTVDFPQGRITSWDAETRTLHARRTIPVTPGLREVAMQTGEANLSVSGTEKPNPHVLEVFAITAASEPAAREILSRHDLSVTGVDGHGVEGGLDIQTSYNPPEHRVVETTFGSDGTVSSSISVSNRPGEKGITIVTGGGKVKMDKSGRMTVDGKPVDQAKDGNVIHEKTNHSVELFVPKTDGDSETGVAYWLRTEGGRVRVEDVQGTIDARSEHGGFAGSGFDGQAKVVVPRGRLDMHDATFHGSSTLAGNTVDLSVKNESLSVNATTREGGVSTPKGEFTTVDQQGGSRLLRRLPNAVYGYFGQDSQPENAVQLQAAQGITVKKSTAE